jgi:hypothetical protein
MPSPTPDGLALERLPEPFRAPAEEWARKILAQYPNTAALIVIGSAALGTWDAQSDLDLVWVLRGRRRKRWDQELDYHYEGPVDLVPLNMQALRRHFAQHSPMAHAIQQGVAIYDPTGLLARLRPIRLGPPTQEWLQEWWGWFSPRLDWGIDSYRREAEMHARFCRDECRCHVSEILTRAVVNLARVLLATEGMVPNTKTEMRAQYPRVIPEGPLRAAMETALRAHHEKRDLTLPEGEQLVALGEWLREKLRGILGEPVMPKRK